MNKTIQLLYIKGIIPEESLELLRSNLANHDIGFEWHDLSGAPQAGAEDLFAPIILFLSSDVVQAYILGLATNATYDLIKSSVLKIWCQISGKTISKITSTNIQTIEASFDLDVNTSGKTRVKFKLRGNIPDKLKEKCIDKAFQLLETRSFPKIHTKYICVYDVDNEQWEILENPEFNRKYIVAKKG